MNIDLNILSMELSKAAFGAQRLPPKLRYRISKWLKSLNPSQNQQLKRSEVIKHVKTQLVKQFSEGQVLAKNEVMASTYDTGAVRLDFGSDVPEKVKKAAMDWAKRKGLMAIEASLSKSTDLSTYVMFSTTNKSVKGKCNGQAVWEV